MNEFLDEIVNMKFIQQSNMLTILDPWQSKGYFWIAIFMPKQSKRAQKLIALRALYVCRIHLFMMRIKRAERNIVMDVVDLFVKKNGKDGINEIPEAEKIYRPRAFNMYWLDADSSSRLCKDSQPHLNPREFKKKYRMTHESFKNLVQTSSGIRWSLFGQ